MKENQKKIVILLSVIGAVLLLLLVLYYFADHHVSTDEMYDDIRVVRRNGKNAFVYSLTDEGTIGISDEISMPVLYDYENGIKYSYYFLIVTAQRFHISMNRAPLEHEFFFIDDTGKESGRGNWRFDPAVDYAEHPDRMDSRYLRVYYANPDGSMVLVWEHPQAPEIEGRVGTPIRAPQDYRIGAGDAS